MVRAHRGRRGLLAGLALALLAALLWPGPAPGLSEREVEQRMLAITGELRCPTCQGISVKDSDASFSRQIKEKVRRMVEEGQSEEQIKAYFVSRYGEWILRAPKKEGLGLVVWLLPFVGMGVVGLLIGWRVYRNTREPSEAEQAAAPQAGDSGLTPEQLARIERDLKRYEEVD